MGLGADSDIQRNPQPLAVLLRRTPWGEKRDLFQRIRVSHVPVCACLLYTSSLGAYEYLVTQSETITRAYGISIFITLVGTVAGLLFTAMFGYALSRKIIRGRRGLNFYVFFTLLFNGGMVPTYLMYVLSLIHILWCK